MRNQPAADGSSEQELSWPGNAQTIQLELPRFAVNATLDMRPVVEQQGLKSLFSNSDLLSGLFTNPQPLDEVTQTVAFKADETGAEAAAVTTATSTRAMAAKPKVVRFDRPFLFTLNHPQSGSVLFAGAVSEPERWQKSEAATPLAKPTPQNPG